MTSFTPQSERGKKNIAGETSHGFNSSMRGLPCLRAGRVWYIKRLDLAVSSKVSGKYGTENASAALKARQKCNIRRAETISKQQAMVKQ